MKYLIFLQLLISVNVFSNSLYPFPQDGKWGYIDNTGKVIVQATYNSAGPMFEGIGKVAKINERNEYLYGFVNSAGQEVIPPKFSTVSDFSGGIARVKIRNKYFYLLKNGVVVTKNEFDEIFPATNNISMFKVGDNYGYADLSGKIIISPRFTRAYNFSECGLAIVSTNDKRYEYGVINANGQFIVKPEYDGLKHFVNGFSAIRKGRSWKVIDKNGILVSEQSFESVGQFENGLINVLINGKWGFIDSAGRMVIQPKFVVADQFSKGLAIVGDGNLYGYINTKGVLVSSFSFTRATRFNGRLARVAQGKKNGFMNAEGKYNLTDKISSIGSFYSNRARMKVGNFFGYYGNDAKLAIKPTFLYVSDFKDDLAITIAPVSGGYDVSYININGTKVKSWLVLSKPILKNKDVFYSIIYPSVPFYRESDPSSRVIIRANYGHSFIKSHQTKATPINGHGLSGLLYAAEYYARPGYIFSEVVSLYSPPKIGMGLSTYIREYFGVVFETDSPTVYHKDMSAVFFNGATLQRKVSRSTVEDRYFIPFMKVSESFFLFATALGTPVAEYPKSSGDLPNYLSEKNDVRFSGRKDSDEKPISYILNKDRVRVNVSENKFGIDVVHTYPRPKSGINSKQEPIFKVSDNNLKELLKAEEENIINTNQMLEQTNKQISNTTSQTDMIIEKVTTTNTIDLTDAVITDRINNTTNSVSHLLTNKTIIETN